jgi:hypothetical protein
LVATLKNTTDTDKITDNMKKTLFLLSFLLLTLTNFAQQSKVVAVNYTEKILEKGIFAVKPSDMFAKPELWLKVWIDHPVPISMYSEDEKKWQRHLNEKVEDLIQTYSPASDEQLYNNDNLKLPIDQRDIDNEPITPYTWKWLDLEKEENGEKVVAKLRRPNWWILANNADKIGNVVYLELSEQGITGGFTVKKIRVSQIDTRLMKPKREGDYTYRPLTGWFQHETSDVWDYTFSNGETIGATPNHPFFSERRQDYIPIGEIEIGEPIRNPQNEVITLASKVKRTNGTEKVYNLEIYRDHNFLVGKSSLLVHNSCFTALLSDIKKWVHTEFNAQSLEKIKDFEQRLLANDPFVWQEPIYTTIINGKTYLLDGHHRIQAAININFTGEIPAIEIPIAEIFKFNGGIYKNAQDVIIASKQIH